MHSTEKCQDIVLSKTKAHQCFGKEWSSSYHNLLKSQNPPVQQDVWKCGYARFCPSNALHYTAPTLPSNCKICINLPTSYIQNTNAKYWTETDWNIPKMKLRKQHSTYKADKTHGHTYKEEHYKYVKTRYLIIVF